jgi:hypothetical protein
MSAIKTASASGQKKDYTTEIPMFDLEEVLRFVTKIHDLGLETASMPEIAKRCGYTAPTSTPFYRRMVASRHFGLLSKSGADLTVRVKDYLKPDSEGADKRALIEAILGIPRYAEIVQKHDGKKLNTELVANGLSKALTLTDACANICAKAFISSLKFAGLLAPDMIVSAGISEAAGNGALPHKELGKEEKNEVVLAESTETQSHTIYLDKTKQRRFFVTAPIDISNAEIQRIKKWLDYALIVDVDKDNPTKEQEGKP